MKYCLLTSVASLILGFTLGRLGFETVKTSQKENLHFLIRDPDQKQIHEGPIAQRNLDTIPFRVSEGSVPKFSQLSEAALKKLQISCLGPDLILDPVLMEIAGIKTDQFKQLQDMINENQLNWSKFEVSRSIAVEDAKSPSLIIPPSGTDGEAQKNDFKARINELMGTESGGIVWNSIAPTLNHLTGDFGRVPRILSFRRENSEAESGIYRVQIKTFNQFSAQEISEIKDWGDLMGMSSISNMTSFTFNEIPPFLSPYVEK